ncbi:MAG: carbohydrate binding domain-containing protein [Planctomycetota bacterium]
MIRLRTAISRRHARRTRRRGASYVFFLGTAMLVTIIGLSALTVVRVKRQAAEAVNDRTAAQEYAQSAVEQAVLTIYTTANWRNSLAHNTWSAAQPLGEGTFVWKLVDEINGSFTVDRNARVRVYGKGVCNPSTWVYSVLVQPPPEELPTELLTNGNLETGSVSPWWASGCNLKLDTASTHGGANSLLIWQRTSVTASACQTIATTIQTDTTFHVRAWVRTRTSPETVDVGTWVQSGAGWQYFAIATLAGTTSWQSVEGTFTPTWTGALMDAYLEIAGTSLLQEILIDDVSLTSSPSALGVVPGTWRREAQ